MSVKDYEFESIIDENDISNFANKLFSKYINTKITSQIEQEIRYSIECYCDNLIKKGIITDKVFAESLKKLMLDSLRIN